jgi:membrane protein DedA with SNARE-associated domain
MSAGVKYTLGRVGLLLLAVLALLPFRLNIFLTLMIALLVSMLASYFLLRRWRDELVAEVASARQKRAEQKERLRAALAGEDEPPRNMPQREDTQSEDEPRPETP